MSPSGVSGISAFPFWTCQSFDELWIFLVGPAALKYETGRKSETQELILFKSFLGILLLDPDFSSIILLHKFVQVFDTLKIPVHCFGTQDTLKKVICPSILQALFLLLCHFHMNLNMQNSWPNWLSTYCWQFSTGNHLHVKWSTNPRVTSILPAAIFSLCALSLHCPPWSISIARLFFEVSISIFCVLVCRANYFIQFVFPPLLISIV